MPYRDYIVLELSMSIFTAIFTFLFQPGIISRSEVRQIPQNPHDFIWSNGGIPLSNQYIQPVKTREIKLVTSLISALNSSLLENIKCLLQIIRIYDITLYIFSSATLLFLLHHLPIHVLTK